MNTVTQGIRTQLDRTATGTLPVSRLLAGLRVDGVTLPGGEEHLLTSAQGEKGLFRVLSPWRGPWSREANLAPRALLRPGVRGWAGEAWILGFAPPTSASGPGGRASRRLSETLKAWGRGVDDSAPASVARWVRATEEAEKSYRVLLRAGGGGG